MLPNGYPFDLNHLYESWKLVVREGGSVAQCSGVDPAVLRSWQRCQGRRAAESGQVNRRSSAAVINITPPDQEFLLNDALSHLEDCHQYLEGTKSVLALSFSDAHFLHVIGNHDMLAHVAQLGGKVGSCWDEAVAGTNAIALCLESAAPTQVIGAEHFFSSMHSLATTAAPVHDVGGRIIAVVALITPVQDATPHALSMTMTVSRAIENSMQVQYCLREANSRLIEMNAVLSSIADGILVWDSSGIVTHINTTAANMLQLAIPSVQGEWIGSILRLPEVLKEAWEQGRAIKDVETTFGVGEQNVSALASLLPYRADSSRGMGFLLVLRDIADVRRLVNRQAGTQARLRFEDLSVNSPAMMRVVKQARSAAPSSAPVLIRGDDGTGRIQLAQAIHNEGPRAGKPFLAINCNAIPVGLMATEFLGVGSGKGLPGRPSKFELADGGTLLLDRVETLSMEMQSALVHLIESGTVMRLQSHQPIPVDVRIIALTSSDLEKKVADGSFNRRLYYAFFIFSIVVPALRERPEDIRYSAQRCVARLAESRQRQLSIDEEALKVLERYHWPGNSRELENAMEQAAGQCSHGLIRPDDLPDAICSGRVFELPASAHQVLSAVQAQREAIKRAAWVTGGRAGAMADMLGISRTTLWRRLKDMNLELEQFRKR